MVTKTLQVTYVHLRYMWDASAPRGAYSRPLVIAMAANFGVIFAIAAATLFVGDTLLFSILSALVPDGDLSETSLPSSRQVGYTRPFSSTET